MLRRVIAAGAFLILAIIAFCGAGPGRAGPFNSFGLLFLLITIVIWRNWHVIVGDYSPPLFDGLNAEGRGSHYRAGDDHYRQDGSQHYSEPDERRP